MCVCMPQLFFHFECILCVFAVFSLFAFCRWTNFDFIASYLLFGVFFDCFIIDATSVQVLDVCRWISVVCLWKLKEKLRSYVYVDHLILVEYLAIANTNENVNVEHLLAWIGCNITIKRKRKQNELKPDCEKKVCYNEIYKNRIYMLKFASWSVYARPNSLSRLYFPLLGNLTLFLLIDIFKKEQHSSIIRYL